MRDRSEGERREKRGVCVRRADRERRDGEERSKKKRRGNNLPKVTTLADVY